MTNKKIVSLFSGTLFFFLFVSAPCWSQMASVEDNFKQIESLSCRIDTTVSNSKGILSTKGRMILSGSNKRLDAVSPDRMIFSIYKDTYSVYSYQDKSLITKKLRSLSGAHLIFIDEMFWTILFDPFTILHERFAFPPEGQPDSRKSPVTIQSRRDLDSTAVVTFNDTSILKIEYYNKQTLAKRLIFSSFSADKNVSLPHKAVMTVYAGSKETMKIEVQLSEVEINGKISNSVFTRIQP